MGAASCNAPRRNCDDARLLIEADQYQTLVLNKTHLTDLSFRISDGLVETEIAFFARDDEGNVWLLGEYPEEYEDGVFEKAPTWIHGTEGSKAGILMPSNPRPDTPSFPQGWAPSVEWNDRGRVFEVGSQTCVPVDCYEDVLIVDEFNLDEPTFFQVKYYAPGIGNVQIGFKGNDPNGGDPRAGGIEDAQYRGVGFGSRRCFGPGGQRI